MKSHFAAVAPQYRQLRDLDMGAVRRVAGILRDFAAPAPHLRLIDVGTGTGRYIEAVLEELKTDGVPSPRVTAVDATSEMLGSWSARRVEYGCHIRLVIGLAEALPCASRCFDALLSFNAVHLFDLHPFVTEAGRVLHPGGKLLLYTRTPEQNRRTIWGQHFPEFADRETRLHRERALHLALMGTDAFRGARLLPLPWVIRTSLARLIEQARSKSYSTFEFYTQREFEAALSAFERRVRAHYREHGSITARNDHLLVVATRR